MSIPATLFALNESNFTPWSSLIGGILLGTAAALMLLVSGRIAGVSGIIGQLLTPNRDRNWRWTFVGGLLTGGLALLWLMPENVQPSRVPLAVVVLAGLLVGFGTQMASGCTSGHGICGLARLSRRSAVAVATFMGAAALTVFVVRLMGQ